MNHGFTITTCKQSSSLRNGRCHPLHDRKKHAQFAATSSQCWSFFLTFDELCVRSLFHLVRLSMGSFTARFWDNWGKMWGTNCLKCGRMETGCCTMTMCLHTPHLLWGNSWQKNNMTTVPHPVYSPDLAPCDFYVFLKMKLWLKGSVSYPLKRSKQNHNRY